MSTPGDAKLRRFYYRTVTASLVIQIATLVALVVGLVRL